MWSWVGFLAFGVVVGGFPGVNWCFWALANGVSGLVAPREASNHAEMGEPRRDGPRGARGQRSSGAATVLKAELRGGPTRAPKSI